MVELMAEEALLAADTTTQRRLGRAAAVDWSRIALNVLLPVVGVVFALLLGAVMLVILKANPFLAYASLVHGAVGSRFGITQTLVKATPLLLVGLGLDELSMTPGAIPLMKRIIRSVTYGQAAEVAQRVFACATAREVDALLRQEMCARFPEYFASDALS